VFFVKYQDTLDNFPASGKMAVENFEARYIRQDKQAFSLRLLKKLL